MSPLKYFKAFQDNTLLIVNKLKKNIFIEKTRILKVTEGINFDSSGDQILIIILPRV